MKLQISTCHLLVRHAFKKYIHLRIMIIMKEFLFSICFISLSTNLKLFIYIYICIMSKLIKLNMIGR